MGGPANGRFHETELPNRDPGERRLALRETTVRLFSACTPPNLLSTLKTAGIRGSHGFCF